MEDIKELLELTKENNKLLKELIAYITIKDRAININDDIKNLIINVIANGLICNK